MLALHLRLTDLDEHWKSEPMLLIGIMCRKLVLVSIDTSSDVHTAKTRLYTFGLEARSSLPPRRVSTVVRNFSSCRTNRGNNMATILCIDDEPIVLEVQRALLESKGYNVLTASDGAT